MSKETRSAQVGGQTNITLVLQHLNSRLPAARCYPYGSITKTANTIQRMVNRKLIKFDDQFGRWLRCS